MSTTNPLRVSACSALVSLRWCIHFSTRSSAQRTVASAHSSATTAIVASTSAGVALVEHQQHAVRAVAALAALALGGVVQAQHGRRGAAAQDAAAGLEAGLERGERVRGAPLGGGQRVGLAATRVVMTPSVPSLPTNSWVRSGPCAPAGKPPVRTTVPSASTTSRPTTMCSILP